VAAAGNLRGASCWCGHRAGAELGPCTVHLQFVLARAEFNGRNFWTKFEGCLERMEAGCAENWELQGARAAHDFVRSLGAAVWFDGSPIFGFTSDQETSHTMDGSARGYPRHRLGTKTIVHAHSGSLLLLP